MNKMKTRGIVVLFCLLSLAVLAFIGYTANKPKDTDEWSDYTVSESNTSDYDNPASLTETQEPDDADQLAELIYGEKKDFVIVIEGIEETVTMTYTELDFANWPGAAKVSLYIDRDRYNCFIFEGEYDIVPVGSGEEPLSSMHIFPNVGKTAREVFDEIKNNTELSGRGSVAEEGTIESDNHTMLYMKTDGARNTYYAVEYNGGCIVIGMNVEPEAIEGSGIRMNAMARTVKIIR